MANHYLDKIILTRCWHNGHRTSIFKKSGRSRPAAVTAQQQRGYPSHSRKVMWTAVPNAAAMVEEFLGWLPLLQLARCARGYFTAAAMQRLLVALRAYDLVPLPAPGLSPLRLLFHYAQLLWARSTWPLFVFDNGAGAAPGEPRRRIRVQHYRPLRAWPQNQATFPVPRGSFRWAMNLFVDATFAGAARFLQASREQPVAQQAWQVVYRERFEDNQIFEMRTTAVQMERSGFQVELFEESVAVWDATYDEEAQLDCNTLGTWAMIVTHQHMF